MKLSIFCFFTFTCLMLIWKHHCMFLAFDSSLHTNMLNNFFFLFHIFVCWFSPSTMGNSSGALLDGLYICWSLSYKLLVSFLDIDYEYHFGCLLKNQTLGENELLSIFNIINLVAKRDGNDGVLILR